LARKLAAAGFQTIAVNMRGVGKSRGPPGTHHASRSGGRRGRVIEGLDCRLPVLSAHRIGLLHRNRSA
jgi:hypothetical protein